MLFEDYVACDIQNYKYCTAITMEMSCKYNIDLLDKMIFFFFLLVKLTSPGEFALCIHCGKSGEN